MISTVRCERWSSCFKWDQWWKLIKYVCVEIDFGWVKPLTCKLSWLVNWKTLIFLLVTIYLSICGILSQGIYGCGQLCETKVGFGDKVKDKPCLCFTWLIWKEFSNCVCLHNIICPLIVADSKTIQHNEPLTSCCLHAFNSKLRMQKSIN